MGTMDTKEEELLFCRDLIARKGLKVLLLDAGILKDPRTSPDITRQEVARAAGIADLASLLATGDKGKCIETMIRGVTAKTQELLRQTKGHGIKRISALLSSSGLYGRVLIRILEISGIDPALTFAHLTGEQRRRLVGSLTELPLTIADLGDFSIAMVTRGGIALSEINARTMESRLVRNLYITGEVLDIDGDTGGYNLQAAFSTGRLAAASIRKTRS